MEVSRMIELTRIEELKILHNVRVIHRHDLNPLVSTENLHVQFEVRGDVRGSITCHLCLDGKELGETDRNVLFPLFTEAMNILVGRQLSLDEELRNLSVKLSPPKFSAIAREISTASRGIMQKYELDLDERIFDVLIGYSLEGMN